MKPRVKDTSKSETNINDLINVSESDKGTNGGNKVESTLDPRLQKYVCDSFEGVGKEAQDNFNNYLRENVWCDETLSNREKIDIMKANFDKLTPE